MKTNFSKKNNSFSVRSRINPVQLRTSSHPTFHSSDLNPCFGLLGFKVFSGLQSQSLQLLGQVQPTAMCVYYFGTFKFTISHFCWNLTKRLMYIRLKCFFERLIYYLFIEYFVKMFITYMYHSSVCL